MKDPFDQNGDPASDHSNRYGEKADPQDKYGCQDSDKNAKCSTANAEKHRRCKDQYNDEQCPSANTAFRFSRLHRIRALRTAILPALLCTLIPSVHCLPILLPAIGVLRLTFCPCIFHIGIIRSECRSAILQVCLDACCYFSRTSQFLDHGILVFLPGIVKIFLIIANGFLPFCRRQILQKSR